jgi:hypothetical protein
MWDEACTAVCRRHDDVVAVFESPVGRLALLLRQPLVPAPDERADWLTETQRSARAVTASLRAAGRRGEITVLQWQSLRQVAHIMADWDCSYEGDEIRHAELVASICAWLTDGGPITPPVAGLGRWYRRMTPSWMSVEPLARRRLILRTHRWIAERVLEPLSQDEEPARDDLEADGLLASWLSDAVPSGERESWQPWVDVVRARLRRALAWPGAQRNDVWVRWLFLIPYGVPARGEQASPRPEHALAGAE